MAVGNAGSGGRVGGGDNADKGGDNWGMACHGAPQGQDAAAVAGEDSSTVSEVVRGRREHGAQDDAARRGSGNEIDAGGGGGVVSEALEALDSYLVSVLMPDLSALACQESVGGRPASVGCRERGGKGGGRSIVFQDSGDSGGGKGGGRGVVGIGDICRDMCRGELRYRSVARLQQAAQQRDESNPFAPHASLLFAYLPLISACQHSCVPNAIAVAAVSPPPCLTACNMRSRARTHTHTHTCVRTLARARTH